MKKTKVGFTNWCVPILIFSSLVWGEMSFEKIKKNEKNKKNKKNKRY